MDEAPDEALMLAYRDGNAAAFETLYGRHRARLYRFMLRGVKDRAAAEEMFQDVWMRVVDARGRYSPQAKFTTWLYTIAHNRLVDHWRQKGLSTVALDEGEGEGVPDETSDPARRAEARQSLGLLLGAIEALPHAQREAFLLHEEAGLTIEEIATATGTNAEAAKSRLRYAMSKLKAAMSDG
jgi:RNA polymerase sigma-70 factor (ECF subfamily)